jgi:hypothetical protein
MSVSTAFADFRCERCCRPLEEEDFGDLGLRLPYRGESREEYFDAELLDSVTHLRCTSGAV